MNAISVRMLIGAVRSMFVLMGFLAASSANAAEGWDWDTARSSTEYRYATHSEACTAYKAFMGWGAFACVFSSSDSSSAFYSVYDQAGTPWTHKGSVTIYKGTLLVTTTTTTATTTTTTVNACASKAGQSGGEQNVTIGWGNTSSVSSVPSGSGGIPTSTCINSCRATTGAPSQCWYSTEPSVSGMYRASCDVPTTFTGASCTASPETPDPAAPPVPPACAQNGGTVNGKPVCLDPNPKPTPASLPKIPLAGNPVPGSTASTGSPRSFDPSTGAGSTAAPGAAGAAGGTTVPYGSTAGGTAGPTTVNVDVPENCGKPGQPKCSIDESGTPDGEGAFGDASDALGTAMEGAGEGLGTVTDPNGKDTSWGWNPLSWVSPGSCQPLNYGQLGPLPVAIAFDMCPALEMASEVLTFFWAIGTIMLCISMVWQTIQNQGA